MRQVCAGLASIDTQCYFLFKWSLSLLWHPLSTTRAEPVKRRYHKSQPLDEGSTGCPRDETPWSVDVFATHCTGPSGPHPMSCLRRSLLPVTSSSFTALKHHSRSWRRHAREFEVKPLSFRLKPQPTTTAEATLVGQISLPSLPTQPMSGPTPPISAYLRRLRRAARGGWRQLDKPRNAAARR